MKISIKFFLALPGLTASFYSCSVYIPNGANTPMFSRKGEAQINASVGSGINIQGAYAVTDHFGIMANGYYTNSTEDSGSNDTRKGSGQLFEGGIGYYNKSGAGLAFETYAGAGFGSVSIDRATSAPLAATKFEASAVKFFIQPTIGYSGKNFEIGLTPRLTMLNYQKPATTYSKADLAVYKFVDIDQTNWMFFEPMLTIRGGGERLKGQIQAGHSFKINKEELGYSSGIFNVGIIYKFGGSK